VPDAPALRRILPHVSPRRNDSVFYLPNEVEVEAALEFLDKHNRTRRPSDPPRCSTSSCDRCRKASRCTRA
jgi:hypothetical protein